MWTYQSSPRLEHSAVQFASTIPGLWVRYQCQEVLLTLDFLQKGHGLWVDSLLLEGASNVMDLDPLSIVTPARVKVLLLPIGENVRESRFASFVKRLQHVNVVRLGDVSPDSRPHRSIQQLAHALPESG
jgi:hypothetical protein